MSAHALVARIAQLWRKRTVTITEEDPTFRTVYLGNTVSQWAQGKGSADKPLATLWRNYCQSCKPDIEMRVTLGVSGLKATTRQHGLTEYWSHRVTYALAHPAYPKIFCWIYRHEGRRMKPELRCHAVLCSSEAKAQLMQRLVAEGRHQALVDFKKEKQLRQNARLSVVSVLYPPTPRRKVFLSSIGTHRPPLERSKSAPKLSRVEEDYEGEEAAAREHPALNRRQRRLRAVPEEEGEPAAAAAARPRTPLLTRALSEPLTPPLPVSRYPLSPDPAGSDPAHGEPMRNGDPTARNDVPHDETAMYRGSTTDSGISNHSDTSPQSDSATHSDSDSELSAMSVPSDPQGGGDCSDGEGEEETLLLTTTPGQCRVYQCRLEQLVGMGEHWEKAMEEDAASDESGFSEGAEVKVA